MFIKNVADSPQLQLLSTVEIASELSLVQVVIVSPKIGNISAYSGKAAVAYGEFHISGNIHNDAP
jgi:hypothetical protein